MNERKFQRKLEKIKKQGERYKREYEVKAAYEKYLPEKKKRKTSTIMVIVSVIAVVGWAIANYILQYNTGNEISTTLSALWFSFWTVEICLLAGIKRGKTKYGANSVIENITSEIEDLGDNEVSEEDYGENVAG